MPLYVKVHVWVFYRYQDIISALEEAKLRMVCLKMT